MSGLSSDGWSSSNTSFLLKNSTICVPSSISKEELVDFIALRATYCMSMEKTSVSIPKRTHFSHDFLNHTNSSWRRISLYSSWSFFSSLFRLSESYQSSLCWTPLRQASTAFLLRKILPKTCLLNFKSSLTIESFLGMVGALLDQVWRTTDSKTFWVAQAAWNLNERLGCPF